VNRSSTTLDPPHPSYEEAAKACAELYRPFGRFAHGYVRGKLLHDPVYRQLAERGPLRSPVIDLGCGRGQTEMLLEALFPGGSYVGYDWDEAKIAMARECATRRQVARECAFHAGDLRDLQVPRAATVLLLDVLHYFSVDAQDSILERAVAALEPGGSLFVRDIDAGHGWRGRINAWQERLGCWLGLNRGVTLCFRPMEEIVLHLDALGLETTRTASWRGTPLANVLIEGVVGRRDGAEPPPTERSA